MEINIYICIRIVVNLYREIARRNSEGAQSTLRRIVQVRLEMISGQSAKEKDYSFQPSLKLSMIFQLTTNFSHL